MNVTAITMVFEGIKLNNEYINTLAIEVFKEFVRNKKAFYLNDQGYLTNCGYPMDLLHLMRTAFTMIAVRGIELPKVNAEDCGGWHGQKAARLYFEIIGKILQKQELDSLPRLRQILSSGIHYIFCGVREAVRTIDVDGSTFHGAGATFRLGINSYYNDVALNDWGRIARTTGWENQGGSMGVAYNFQDLLQAITPVFKASEPASLQQKKQRCLIM